MFTLKYEEFRYITTHAKDLKQGDIYLPHPILKTYLNLAKYKELHSFCNTEHRLHLAIIFQVHLSVKSQIQIKSYLRIHINEPQYARF